MRKAAILTLCVFASFGGALRADIIERNLTKALADASYCALVGGSTVPGCVMTGQILGATGSASAPSYSFSAASGIGTFLDSSNIIGFSTSANFYLPASSTLFTRLSTTTTGGISTAILMTSTSPSAPSAALAGGGAGNVDNGTHVYEETCVTAGGETNASASSAAVTVVDHTTNGKVTVTLTACPAGGGQFTTGRNLYKSKAGTTTPLFLVAASPVIGDPSTTTTYTDNIADASLQAGMAPTINSAVDARMRLGGSGSLVLPSAGFLTWVSGADLTAASDTIIGRPAAATIQFGAGDAASAVAQTTQVQSVVAGTSNTAGAVWTFVPSKSTGNGAGSATAFNRDLMGASGTTQNSTANAVVICESKTLSNTSATAQTLATIAAPSNSAGGFMAFITVVATDGTNFDAETQQVTDSWVNKAGVFTVGSALITTSTAASNSGSTTIGATVTGASSLISVKVTPVFSTIVPTLVTSYIEIHNHGAGAVVCQ